MTARERREKKAAVLASLGNGSTKSAASEAAGIDRSTLYGWLKSDKRFSERVEEALAAQVSVVEDALYTEAVGGDVKAMIHYLRCRAPDKWEPNKRVDMNANVANARGELYDWEEIRRETNRIYAELHTDAVAKAKAELLAEQPGKLV